MADPREEVEAVALLTEARRIIDGMDSYASLGGCPMHYDRAADAWRERVDRLDAARSTQPDPCPDCAGTGWRCATTNGPADPERGTCCPVDGRDSHGGGCPSMNGCPTCHVAGECGGRGVVPVESEQGWDGVVCQHCGDLHVYSHWRCEHGLCANRVEGEKAPPASFSDPIDLMPVSEHEAALAQEREKNARLREALEKVFDCMGGPDQDGWDAPEDVWGIARAALAPSSGDET